MVGEGGFEPDPRRLTHEYWSQLALQLFFTCSEPCFFGYKPRLCLLQLGFQLVALFFRLRNPLPAGFDLLQCSFMGVQHSYGLSLQNFQQQHARAHRSK